MKHFIISVLLILLMLSFIAILKADEPQDYPPEDLVYVTQIGLFKEIIIIPKGSLNPEHRGKIWQTKKQWEAEWKQALEWRDEILKEKEESQ